MALKVGDDEGMVDLSLGVLEGDGIGGEIVPATVRVVDAAMRATSAGAITWQNLPFGASAIQTHGSPLPPETQDALSDLPGWLLGPHDNASYPDEFRTMTAPGGTIRKRYGLYANIRPAVALPGVRSVRPDIDVVIVRENTEGFYADRNMFTGSGEFMPTKDVAMAVAVVTREACTRIARTAFTLAQQRRNRVTVVHKANVLPLTTGLFLETCREVGHEFPGVRIDDVHVDAMAAHLVRGGDYDVIVTENMFGDILSDLAGELSGSLGIAASLNTSDTQAMAQAAHGAAPDIAGRNRANPIAMFMSAAMLLDWFAQREGAAQVRRAAQRIRRAVTATTTAGVATADLGGLASTSEFTENVLARVARWS
ncbi:isocitrate/isopropylmalate dehydrogenase family protein [Hoyosella subflava]|uniref:Putative 3-isopropylmalate dehydrogenase n=1 Tax=Hoyosella subflava (strain DSM 45089 / JCM 17490 / NBRC 109087 / DQS3-9A1) TaxID=443218 RepID=F6EHY5_HOYSD|nr:Putative 3-isopropylmalate dehydrogenase [Hoyosella subflava DQS3-9A1]